MKKAFIAAAAVCAASWLWLWARLPERVPTHFSGSGAPDSYSSRGVALWSFAVLAAGTALLFLGLVRLVGRISPDLISVPHVGFWKRPENMGRLRALMAEDMWIFGAWTLLLVAAIQVVIVRAAGMAQPRMDPWVYVAIGLYVGGVLARTIWMMTARYAVPRSTA